VKPPENQFIAGYSFEIKELEPVDTDWKCWICEVIFL
jgi:hypothetical protein